MTTPADHAQAAAEAIRELNHATLPSAGGLVWPSDTDAVIGALHTLAYRLPQALSQVHAWLMNAHRAGSVGHDQGTDTGLALDLLGIALDQARADAARLAHSLDLARAESSHLTGTGDPT